jgi:hypothetical protein
MREGNAIMSRNPNRGRIYRRCACRDTNGKQLGARCPKLTNRRHGRWAFAVDLPTLDRQRKTLRRCGPPKPTPAQRSTGFWRASGRGSTLTIARPLPSTSTPGWRSNNAR